MVRIFRLMLVLLYIYIYIYICYAQRSKTLSGRKKRPQRVVAFKDMPWCESRVVAVKGNVKFKDRKRSMSGKNDHNVLWDYRNSHNAKFRVPTSWKYHKMSWSFTILQPRRHIFCRFGAPFILESDNGREFANKIIQNLADMWPGMKLLHGKPGHSES